MSLQGSFVFRQTADGKIAVELNGQSLTGAMLQKIEISVDTATKQPVVRLTALIPNLVFEAAIADIIVQLE